MPTSAAMVKTVLCAVVVLATFAGALYAGGNVMGAWEPYDASAAGAPQPAAQPKASPSAAKRRHSNRRHAKPKHAKPARDAAWIRRANTLCGAARRDSEQNRAPRTAEEIKTFLTRGVKRNRYWNRRFLGLGAPRGEAKRFARVRALFREDEAALAGLVSAVRDADGASAMLLGEELLELAQRESSLLVALGARECSLPSTAS